MHSTYAYATFFEEEDQNRVLHREEATMSAAQVDPHDKMRARDVNKVARGEQAPRPAHEYGTVSPPPPPSSTHTIDDTKNKNKVKPMRISSLTFSQKFEKQKLGQYKHFFLQFFELGSFTVQKQGEKSGIAENGAELTESNDYKTCYVKYVEYHR